MTKKEFIAGIPGLEYIFVIYSNATHVPYVACDPETFDDCVYMYCEEDMATERAKQLTEKEEKPAIAVKIPKAQMLKCFSELYAYGINSVCFNGGENPFGKNAFTIHLDEIVRRPDMSKVPEEKRPLENPSLQLSMIYYLQALRKAGEKPSREEVQDLEEEMSVNLTRATYLLPYMDADTDQVNPDGTKPVRLTMVKINDDTAMIPVFTDIVEFNHFRGDKPMKATLTNFEKMHGMPQPPEGKGFIINPSGCRLPITSEYLDKVMGGFSWK